MDNLCGTRTYPNIDQKKVNFMLEALRRAGAEVTGNNPWRVDTKKHGVKLFASWNQSTSELSVQVTGKNFYVPCGEIWKTVDELIRNLPDALPEAEGLATTDSGCGTRSYPNIDQGKIDKMIEAIKKAGGKIEGDNPWKVTLTKGPATIVLGARWEESRNTLIINVISKPWYVSCNRIWTEIDELIRGLGEGLALLATAEAASLCGTRSYPNITQAKVEAMIKALRENGAVVTGNNPWDVDTKQHGVKLRASRNTSTNVLTVEVTGKNFYVPCSRVWSEIEKYLPHVAALSDAELV